jgi:hypothetical protein
MRPVCAAFWEADLVFTGQADVISLGPGAQRARFRIEEALRGSPGRVVEIVQRGIGGSCAYAFVHGTRYLVFARRASDGTWASFFCDPVAPLDRTAESLAFARGTSRDTGRGGSISGLAFVVQPDREEGVGISPPLSRLTVTLTRGTQRFLTTTDSRGQYEFKGVAPGRYLLTVSASPGVGSVGPATVNIQGPGACVVHNIQIEHDGN